MTVVPAVGYGGNLMTSAWYFPCEFSAQRRAWAFFRQARAEGLQPARPFRSQDAWTVCASGEEAMSSCVRAIAELHGGTSRGRAPQRREVIWMTVDPARVDEHRLDVLAHDLGGSWELSGGAADDPQLLFSVPSGAYGTALSELELLLEPAAV